MYDREYVERLRDSVDKLYVITDHAETIPGTTRIEAPAEVKGWWVRPFLFSDEVPHPILALDLDIMALTDLSCFGGKDTLYSIRDYTPGGRRIPNINASVIWIDRAYPQIWETFKREREWIMKNYPTDQHWLWDSGLSWHHYPDNWAVSYRRGVVVPETKVVVFHGRPKPHEVGWEPIRKFDYPDSPEPPTRQFRD